jgi:hypothetical protein
MNKLELSVALRNPTRRELGALKLISDNQCYETPGAILEKKVKPFFNELYELKELRREKCQCSKVRLKSAIDTVRKIKSEAEKGSQLTLGTVRLDYSEGPVTRENILKWCDRREKLAMEVYENDLGALERKYKRVVYQVATTTLEASHSSGGSAKIAIALYGSMLAFGSLACALFPKDPLSVGWEVVALVATAVSFTYAHINSKLRRKIWKNIDSLEKIADQLHGQNCEAKI